MARQSTLPIRRGLSEADACAYVGNIGSTKFQQLIAAGQMPRPRLIGTRRVWAVAELDAAFDSLPVEGAAPIPDTWDDFRHGSDQTQAC
jgi:hypothetical protein